MQFRTVSYDQLFVMQHSAWNLIVHNIIAPSLLKELILMHKTNN